jgi:hypothetical protein
MSEPHSLTLDPCGRSACVSDVIGQTGIPVGPDIYLIDERVERLEEKSGA